MKNRGTIIAFPVFDYNVYVELTSNIKEALLNHEDTKYVEYEDDTNALAVHVQRNHLSYIFLPHLTSPGVIAHEAWHAIRKMMTYVGADLDSETVAHHLGYLVDEISTFMLKRRKKK
jgi:hypothetical protein